MHQLLVVLLSLLFVPLTQAAATEDRAALAFFESRIRPIFLDHCVECHGPSKQKGGLRLDTRRGREMGGESGPVLIAGDPDHSRLIRAVRREDPDFAMPPKKSLTPSQVESLVEWVRRGAVAPPDPLAAGADAAPNEPGTSGPALRPRRFALTPEDREWWAFRPVQRPVPPAVSTAVVVHNPVDRFVMARLEQQGLRMNPGASPRERLRRVYYDLTGLPPSLDQVRAFERDPSPAAWERVIDALLASPRYGERWARHWLDLVRYAESNGYERDGAKPHAWRYRDYVVRAFNSDKPYDRFVVEQLAGDELEYSEDAVVATGFYRLHVWDDEPDSTLVAEFDDLDDVMVTTGATFLGLTLGCARCHDHKFDPISQADYYRMLAFVRSVNPYGLHHTGGGGRGTGRITRPLASPETVTAWEQSRAERINRLRAALAAESDKAKRAEREAAIKAEQAIPAPYPMALAITEDTVKPTHILRRGDVHTPGEEVQPGVPAVFEGLGLGTTVQPPRSGQGSGRRLTLARWIADQRNPLTARVMMNRLWQRHFGAGLSSTPDDFGRTGQPPSHPELLDFLAAEFMEGGWQLKRMHRLILTSRAYQMSSASAAGSGATLDEANRWFWRQNPRRLDAEALRDSLIQFGGTLNLAMGGPGFFPTLPREVHSTQDAAGKGWADSSPSEQSRRSIYAVVKRALPIPFLESFDAPSTTVPTGTRSRTTVAPQALMLLNDGFVQTHAAHLAARIQTMAEDRKGTSGSGRVTEPGVVRRAFEIVLQRTPTAAESQAALAFLEANRTRPDALALFCVALVNVNEALYID